MEKLRVLETQKSSIITTYPNFRHVYQIYYNDESRKQCFDHFNKYHNSTLTPFFENSVIKDILESRNFSIIPDQEWLAILSPKFFSKARGYGRFVSPSPLHDFLSNTDSDCFGFQSKSTHPNVIRKAQTIHTHFTEVMQMLLDKAGIEYDLNQNTRIIGKHRGYKIRATIYSNYIFAKKWVWKKYRDQFFLPMYNEMENAEGRLKELLWSDSGYRKKHKLKDRLINEIGVPHYPYHTFVCERFWTMFLNLNPEIKVTQYGL